MRNVLELADHTLPSELQQLSLHSLGAILSPPAFIRLSLSLSLSLSTTTTSTRLFVIADYFVCLCKSVGSHHARNELLLLLLLELKTTTLITTIAAGVDDDVVDEPKLRMKVDFCWLAFYTMICVQLSQL